MNVALTPEWSYPVDVEEIGDGKMPISISAGKEEMARLVQRLAVASFDSLSADLTLNRIDGGRVIEAKGRIRASLTQQCVITTDPVKEQVDTTFEAWFADPEQAIVLAKAKRERLSKNGTGSGGGEVPMLEEREDPEPIVDGKIDVGELVVQHLSLALNPYPHAEGVEYEYGDDTPEKVPEAFKESPFAALKDWRKDG